MLLYLDGVYTTNTHGDVIFRKLHPPRFEDMVSVIEDIRNRVILLLQRRGLLNSEFESVDVDLVQLTLPENSGQLVMRQLWIHNPMGLKSQEQNEGVADYKKLQCTQIFRALLRREFGSV